MASKSLDDLHPRLAVLAREHIAHCALSGIDLLIYCTLRSIAEQDELYTHGRTAPGPIVTNAKGGQSAHNYGLAYDCVPLINGKAAWDDADKYAIVGQFGEALGLEWGFHWTHFHEKPHFQFLDGLTIDDLQAGKMIAP